MPANSSPDRPTWSTAARSISNRISGQKRRPSWRRPAAACILLAASIFPASANPGLENWSKPPRPTHSAPRVIGSPAAGCVAGAVPLAPDGPGYQAIRVSRNRHWAHPLTVRYMSELGTRIERAGMPPVYVGDMSQPRGGPMSFGHASHQTGLDIDIWFNLLPKPRLHPNERENPVLPSLVTSDQEAIDESNFSPAHVELLRMAAEPARVDRIFVHWQIKKRLCEIVPRPRPWLAKIRAWYGHMEHFHVRLSCPADSPDCVPQATVGNDDGCGKDIDWWLTVAQDRVRGRSPSERTTPLRPKMPEQCGAVYRSP